jgi:hypothetical protein
MYSFKPRTDCAGSDEPDMKSAVSCLPIDHTTIPLIQGPSSFQRIGLESISTVGGSDKMQEFFFEKKGFYEDEC